MFKFFTPKKVIGVISVAATSAYVFNEWKKGPNSAEVKKQAEERAANAGKTETFYGASGYGFPIVKQNVDVPTAPTMKFGSGSNE